MSSVSSSVVQLQLFSQKFVLLAVRGSPSHVPPTRHGARDPSRFSGRAPSVVYKGTVRSAGAPWGEEAPGRSGGPAEPQLLPGPCPGGLGTWPRGGRQLRWEWVLIGPRREVGPHRLE